MPDERPNPPEDRQSGLPDNGPETETGSPSFWTELKRRNVVRVATVYAVVGWLIIQIASATFEGFGIPPWAFRFVVMIVLLGFPVSLVITWAFELTPEGIKTAKAARRVQAEQDQGSEMRSSRTWLAIGFAAAVPTLIFGALALFFFVQTRSSEPAPIVADEAATAPIPIAVEVTPAPIEDATLSIAMMPLINMSSSEENAYFAGGIHEDVLTNLSRIDDLKVVSRTTMLRYAASEMTIPEIGTALDVDYIVEGSVRRIGNHVRVTVQLIAAQNDEHLWASNYERELVDVFATQSELAREIGNAIHLEIQPESVGTLAGMPTTSVLAYDLYLKAISIEKTEDTTEENVLKGTSLLEQAVEVDPDFVEAWAVLKRRYDYMRSRVVIREWFMEDDETKEEAIARLETMSDRAMGKAMTLDSDNLETRLSMAVDHVWPQPPEVMVERRQIFDAILEAHPENAMAWYHLAWWYRHRDPPDDVESIACFEAALKLDPFNARIVRAVLERYRNLVDEENVTRLASRLTEIVPEVAEDRRLALIHGFQRIIRIRQAFLATADPSLLDDYARAWENPETWQDWDNRNRPPDVRIWSGMRLMIYRNDLDRAIQLSKEWEPPTDGDAISLSSGSYIHTMAMKAYLALGAQPEAQATARRLVEIHERIDGRQTGTEVWEQAGYGWALAVLGDMEGALEQGETLLSHKGTFDSASEAAALLLSAIDLDRAVDLVLTIKKEHPTWNGMDIWAATSSNHREFALHPRIKEYYLAEDKWVDFLAERFPEYAEAAAQE